ncbi:hypothetical protein ACSBR2_034247 [Camellia fascicularis]
MFFKHCLDQSCDFAWPHNMRDSSIEVMEENHDASQEAKVEAISESFLISLHVLSSRSLQPKSSSKNVITVPSLSLALIFRFLLVDFRLHFEIPMIFWWFSGVN